MITYDQDAVDAAIDLVGRAGARNLEFGYLHDDVPSERAAWWAQASYGGDRIIVENHADPALALEALAVRLLTGAVCINCQGLITLRDGGAVAYQGQLADGSTMTHERARSMPQCRWRRVGPEWVRGCIGTHPEKSHPGPNRAERRRRRHRR